MFYVTGCQCTAVIWNCRLRFYRQKVSDLHPDCEDEFVFDPLSFEVSVLPFASWQLQPIINASWPLPVDTFIPTINPP
jgi:hypothetical protein